jgi:cytochrome c2
MRTLIATALLAAGLLLPAPPAGADETANLFRQSCMSCHTIGGGKLVGPDLKDVEQRKDRAWLADFIVNPKRFLDAGDPYAQKLKE